MDNLWIIYGSGWTDWWYTNPSETYESIGMMTFPIDGKLKNVPNHQTVKICWFCQRDRQQDQRLLLCSSSVETKQT